MLSEKKIIEIVDRHCGAFFGKDYGDKKVDFTMFGEELKKELLEEASL